MTSRANMHQYALIGIIRVLFSRLAMIFKYLWCRSVQGCKHRAGALWMPKEGTAARALPGR